MSEQPPTYEVGQIVNGHRWTGRVWEPVTEPSLPPPDPTQLVTPPTVGGPTPPAKKPLWKRWWVWVAGVVALLLVIGIASSGAGSQSGAGASASPSPTPSESSPAPSETPSSSPTEQPSESPRPTPVAQAVVYSGRGNKVLKIKKPDSGAVLMTTTIKGPSDNNTVYALDSDLKEGQLLVNTIGSYRGSAILDKSDGDDTTRLKIDVSGSWVITLKPLRDARVITTAAKGSKDDVLVYASDQPAIMTFKSTSGDSNVTAYWYTENGSDLLVNDIGKFSAEAPMTAGPGFIEVSSDGAWTITIAPA